MPRYFPGEIGLELGWFIVAVQLGPRTRDTNRNPKYTAVSPRVVLSVVE